MVSIALVALGVPSVAAASSAGARAAAQVPPGATTSSSPRHGRSADMPPFPKPCTQAQLNADPPPPDGGDPSVNQPNCLEDYVINNPGTKSRTMVASQALTITAPTGPTQLGQPYVDVPFGTVTLSVSGVAACDTVTGGPCWSTNSVGLGEYLPVPTDGSQESSAAGISFTCPTFCPDAAWSADLYDVNSDPAVFQNRWFIVGAATTVTDGATQYNAYAQTAIELLGPSCVQVTGVKAATGPVTGERVITVSGKCFAPGGTPDVSSVQFAPLGGGKPISARSFKVASDTELTAVTPDVTSRLPKGTPGEITLATDVVVTAGSATTPKTGADRFTFEPVSIVQLGDSISAGEGTLYGYHYHAKTGLWYGGGPGAWLKPYPLCHDSPDAYGNVVTGRFADARLTQLSCTGANYENGIIAAKYDGKTFQRPAELGLVQDPNPDYVAAEPDVVVITEGADEIEFADIVTACIESVLKHLVGKQLECTSTNPGPTVQRDFLNTIKRMPGQYRAMVSTIERLGAKAGKVPRIVFTSYMDPLPPADLGTCHDTWVLEAEQLAYMNDMLDQLNRMIATTITGMHDPNVGFVDLSKSFEYHTWCTSDPWDYGLSILYNAYDRINSLAPFHPTPYGQDVIASRVLPEVRAILAKPPEGAGD